MSTKKTFLDTLCLHLADNGLNDKELTYLNQWMEQHEYDSDSLIYDAYETGMENSNIVTCLQSNHDKKKYFNLIRKYISNYMKENIFNQVIVIGISGATRSGKSTLAYYLSQHLGKHCCKILEQDSFFDFGKICNDLNGNWDHPKAIKHKEFYYVIKNAINHYSSRKPRNKNNRKFYIILEGFMLFYKQKMIKLINYFIWIEIPKEICFKRREETKPEGPYYFNQNIWPNHTKYKKQVFGLNKNKNEFDKDYPIIDNSFSDEMLIIDGTIPINEYLKKTLVAIDRSELAKSKK